MTRAGTDSVVSSPLPAPEGEGLDAFSPTAVATGTVPAPVAPMGPMSGSFSPIDHLVDFSLDFSSFGA